MLLKQIYEHKLNQYRKRVDSHIEALINQHAKDPLINEMLHYAIESGRRFRPLLFLLSHKIFQRDLPETAFQLAAALELLHKASLIHDDLLDGDEFRRGKASYYHTYGQRSAIIAGDLLVGLAFEQFLAHTTDPFLLKEWSALYRRLAMGEMQDVVWEGQWELSEEQLRAMIDGKTASFLEFAMKAGSYLATHDPKIATQMGLIGTELGFTFQIMNDLNNWHGLEAELGRNPQGDISSGKVNLVTQLVRQYQQSETAAAGSSGNLRYDQLGNPESLTHPRCSNEQNQGRTQAELEEAIINHTKDMAETHIKTARRILAELKVQNQYTQVLEHIMKEFDQKWFWVERDTTNI